MLLLAGLADLRDAYLTNMDSLNLGVRLGRDWAGGP